MKNVNLTQMGPQARRIWSAIAPSSANVASAEKPAHVRQSGQFWPRRCWQYHSSNTNPAIPGIMRSAITRQRKHHRACPYATNPVWS